VSPNWFGTLWWKYGTTWKTITFPEPDWVRDGSLGSAAGYSVMKIDMSGVDFWVDNTITEMTFTFGQVVDDAWDISEVIIDNGSATNRRGGSTGLFISKPGQNVMSCSDGDLLFDSTAPEFMQVLAKGTAIVPGPTLGLKQIYLLHTESRITQRLLLPGIYWPTRCPEKRNLRFRRYFLRIF